jgi:hypothetical protein
MTLHRANVQTFPRFGAGAVLRGHDTFDLATSNLTDTGLDMTGLNGHVTLGIKFPIWLITCLAISVSLFLVADGFSSIAIPRLLLWAIAICSLVLTVLPLMIALRSGHATPGIGWFLGLACATTPIVVLWLSRASRQSSVAKLVLAVAIAVVVLPALRYVHIVGRLSLPVGVLLLLAAGLAYPIAILNSPQKGTRLDVASNPALPYIHALAASGAAALLLFLLY